MATLTFRNMYQMGFIVGGMQQAQAYMRQRFGIERFRVLGISDDFIIGHAYIGDIMIELIQIGESGPSYLASHRPEDADGVVFHHHAYRVFDKADWEALSCSADETGLPVYRQSVMNGDLQTIFVDLRSELGLYAEYVYLTGNMRGYYDDVPRN